MKVVGDVQISNRLQPSFRGTYQRSSLVIGQESSTEKVFLLLQNAQHKCGTKYAIVGNVEKIFIRCLNEGKATIRFTNPAHDMSINCADKILLKSFIHTLQVVISNKTPIPPTRLSSLYSPARVVPKPKTKMIITCKSQYPYLGGFSRILQELSICGIELKSIESKILRLQMLRTLDLSNNCLTTLPEALGTLPCLVSLNLSNNKLGTATNGSEQWAWLHDNIGNVLKLLDLSSNDLEVVPNAIGHLRALVNLKLDKNQLKELPSNLGRLSQLRYLSVSMNCICTFPASLSRLRLEIIDIYGNDYKHILFEKDIKIDFPSLFECSARTIINRRLNYIGVVPRIMAKYLDGARYCRCGSACFEAHISEHGAVSLQDISTTVISGDGANDNLLPTVQYFCCRRCAGLM